MDRQRVHAACELVGECGVDHAVALDPALSAKRFRHNIKPEMGLTARPMARVAGVLVRFIFDAQTLRGENLAQLFRDNIRGSHGQAFGQAASRSISDGMKLPSVKSCGRHRRRRIIADDEHELTAL
jgi:hypothetical protein